MSTEQKTYTVWHDTLSNRKTYSKIVSVTEGIRGTVRLGRADGIVYLIDKAVGDVFTIMPD